MHFSNLPSRSGYAVAAKSLRVGMAITGVAVAAVVVTKAVGVVTAVVAVVIDGVAVVVGEPLDRIGVEVCLGPPVELVPVSESFSPPSFLPIHPSLQWIDRKMCNPNSIQTTVSKLATLEMDIDIIESDIRELNIQIS